MAVHDNAGHSHKWHMPWALSAAMAAVSRRAAHTVAGRRAARTAANRQAAQTTAGRRAVPQSLLLYCLMRIIWIVLQLRRIGFEWQLRIQASREMSSFPTDFPAFPLSK